MKHLWHFLQYVYIIVDPLLLILRNTFGNPYDIPNLLLSKLDIGVKDAVIELLLKRQSIQENFMLEKLVFHSLVTSCSIKEITIFLPNMVFPSMIHHHLGYSYYIILIPGMLHRLPLLAHIHQLLPNVHCLLGRVGQ